MHDEKLKESLTIWDRHNKSEESWLGAVLEISIGFEIT